MTALMGIVSLLIHLRLLRTETDPRSRLSIETFIVPFNAEIIRKPKRFVHDTTPSPTYAYHRLAIAYGIQASLSRVSDPLPAGIRGCVPAG